MIVPEVQNVDQIVTMPEDVAIHMPVGQLGENILDKVLRLGGVSRFGLILGGSFLMGLSMVKPVRGTLGQSFVGGLGAVSMGLGILPYFLDLE